MSTDLNIDDVFNVVQEKKKELSTLFSEENKEAGQKALEQMTQVVMNKVVHKAQEAKNAYEKREKTKKEASEYKKTIEALKEELQLEKATEKPAEVNSGEAAQEIARMKVELDKMKNFATEATKALKEETRKNKEMLFATKFKEKFDEAYEKNGGDPGLKKFLYDSMLDRGKVKEVDGKIVLLDQNKSIMQDGTNLEPMTLTKYFETNEETSSFFKRNVGDLSPRKDIDQEITQNTDTRDPLMEMFPETKVAFDLTNN